MEPGYYRQIKRIKNDEDAHKGDLVFVTHLEGDEVHYVQGTSQCTWEKDAFLLHYQFAPEGLQERQQRMAELMTTMHTLGTQQDQLLLASGDTPHLEAGGEGGMGGLALPTGKDPVKMKDALANLKVDSLKLKNSLAKRSKELQLIIAEQQAILAAKSNALMAQIAQATEQISILRTYLGNDEEIVTLRKGQPADKDSKIHLRQLLLYMDEECTIAAERGGIDFRELHEFDEWLLQDDHLDLVLPEKKGIVAMKPRRKKKDYGDDMLFDFLMNQNNKLVYVLIRNGDNLYRILTPLGLDDVLFPRKDEFEDHFYESEYDHKLKKTVRVPLEPGSVRYMKAMEAANEDQRKYFKVLILLQGLMDRTKVFQPMPYAGRINLCNLEGYKEHLQFIYDAENLLPTGRLPYKQWHSECNDKIEVGCRIIAGYFPHGEGRYENRRIWPRYASGPDTNVLHTIDKEESSGFTFLYERENNYRDEPQRRARYLIYKSDPNILHFDSVTVDDMEFYINSRTNRSEYMSMIPLMRKAIKLKKKEAKEEAPFRKLLIGEIHKECGDSFEKIEAQIDTLISWWKFKNRTHRALNSDDSKVLRMVVAEYVRRKKIFDDAEQATALDNAIVAELRKDEDKTLAVFQVKEREYCVYQWYNAQNVFVEEARWTYTKERDLKCTEVREWRTVDNRHQSWRLLWADDRWKDWKINARAQEHMTDPERDQALEFAMNGLKNKEKVFEIYDGDSRNVWHDDDAPQQKAWGAPLYSTIDDEGRVVLAYAHRHYRAPKRRIITNEAVSPAIGYVAVNFEKKKGLPITFRFGRQHDHNFGWKQDPIPEVMPEPDEWGRQPLLAGPGIWRDNKMIAKFNEEVRKAREVHEAAQELKKKTRPFERQIKAAAEAKFWAEKKAKYFEDFADEELWEEHKKTIHDPHCNPHWLDEMLYPLIEENIELHGMTLRQVAEKLKEMKMYVGEDEENKPSWRRRRSGNYHKNWEEWADIVLDANYPRGDEYYYDDEDDEDEEEESDDSEGETLLLEHDEEEEEDEGPTNEGEVDFDVIDIDED